MTQQKGRAGDPDARLWAPGHCLLSAPRRACAGSVPVVVPEGGPGATHQGSASLSFLLRGLRPLSPHAPDLGHLQKSPRKLIPARPQSELCRARAPGRGQPSTHQLLGPHVVQYPLGVLAVVSALHDGQEQLGSIVLIGEAEGGGNGGERGVAACTHRPATRRCVLARQTCHPTGEPCAAQTRNRLPRRTMCHFRPKTRLRDLVWVFEARGRLGIISP